MNPKTKEEFEAFKVALIERIETFKVIDTFLLLLLILLLIYNESISPIIIMIIVLEQSILYQYD
jgi:hypothetical protein